MRIMTNLTALLTICLAVSETFAAQLKCENTKRCPCGSTNRYVQVCVQTEDEKPCRKWSRCKTCSDRLNRCLQCPEGLEGPFCSRVVRSYCPNLESPKFGSIRCFSNNDQLRTCIGTCLPGYSFQNFNLEEEITLTCTKGVWTPLSTFPDCVSGGHCDLEGAGSFNCTTGTSGKKCDVNCSGKFAGQFHCYPGQPWDPPLPYCVRPKVVPDKKNCSDPGFISNGFRRNTDGSESNFIQAFREGQSVVYGCTSEEYALQGSSLLTCRNDGTWSSPLPRCIKPTDAPNQKSCIDPGFISNGFRMNTNGSGSNFLQAFREGQSVVFVCKSEEYALQGSSFLTCKKDGTWSTASPKCIKLPVAQETVCPDPGQVANANRLNSDGSHSLGIRQYTVGQSVEYTCHPGFALQGRSLITCSASGSWSSKTPYCTQVTSPSPVIGTTTDTSGETDLVYCLIPFPIPNGQVAHYPSISNRSRATPQPDILDEYPEGSRLEYSCNSGFLLKGAVTLICEKSGYWSDKPPVCRRGKEQPGVTEEFPQTNEILDGDVSNQACGRFLPQSTERILHANPTIPGEWPWVVAISIGNNNGVICGGAVLNSRTVITAAHCLQNSSPFTLRFGKFHRKNSDDDEEVIVRNSTQVIIHPNYNSKYDSDIGLVVFQPRIRFSERVQPICLPTAKSTAENLRPGKAGFVTGWGLTENRLPPDNLQWAALPFVTNEDCFTSYRKTNLTLPLTKNMFCAGHINAQQSPCDGDSGSPLVFYDGYENKFTLEGLVSFGGKTQCGTRGIYTIFTKVFEFLPWVLKLIPN